MALSVWGAAACSSAHYGVREEGHAALVVPAHFAERSTESDDAGVAPPTGLEPRLHGAPPDPPALRMADQWRLLLDYDSGVVRVAHAELLHLAHPVVTARRVGRYAVELWIGRELVERVRFDFPLLAAEDPPSGRRRPLHEPPTLAAHARVQQTILVPASGRARRAVLVDRATEQVVELAWPPDRATTAEPH